LPPWALRCAPPIRVRIIHEALISTLTMTAMIFATILAAGFFSLVFIGLGGEERVAHLLENLPGGPTGALLFVMIFVFVLGFFLDFVEISVIVLPLVAPSLILMGHDPIWLGILLAINLQTSFLTPPFGFSLFYLRAAARPRSGPGRSTKVSYPSSVCRRWECCLSGSCRSLPPGFPPRSSSGLSETKEPVSGFPQAGFLASLWRCAPVSLIPTVIENDRSPPPAPPPRLGHQSCPNRLVRLVAQAGRRGGRRIGAMSQAHCALV
jgi:hypothetical protein